MFANTNVSYFFPHTNTLIDIRQYIYFVFMRRGSLRWASNRATGRVSSRAPNRLYSNGKPKRFVVVYGVYTDVSDNKYAYVWIRAESYLVSAVRSFYVYDSMFNLPRARTTYAFLILIVAGWRFSGAQTYRLLFSTYSRKRYVHVLCFHCVG